MRCEDDETTSSWAEGGRVTACFMFHGITAGSAAEAVIIKKISFRKAKLPAGQLAVAKSQGH
jgi:hypothetical protein